MTSHELAKTLLEGPDLPVTRRGYEGGVELITVIDPPTPIHLGANADAWYYGKHEYHEADWCSATSPDSDELGNHPAPPDLAIHLS